MHNVYNNYKVFSRTTHFANKMNIYHLPPLTAIKYLYFSGWTLTMKSQKVLPFKEKHTSEYQMQEMFFLWVF